MTKEKISKILVISGMVVLIVSAVLGIFTLVNLNGYNNTIIPKAETEYSVSGNGKVFEAQTLKNSYLNALLGFTPWTISVLFVGVILLGIGLILKIKRKEVKVR